MLLGEPPRTPVDLNFSLFGFPIRISVWFWVGALLIGGTNSPEGAVAWIAAVLASITIHELGHAFAFRRYGINSRIVLYHLGGLSIPDRDRYSGYAAPSNPWHDIIVSFSGPGAEFAAALVALGIIYLTGLPSNPLLSRFVSYFILVSLVWAIFNLLPVYPLDGGQISRNFFLLFGGGNGIQYSLILSMVVAGLVAVWGFQSRQLYIAIMFAVLGYSSYQTLQAYRSRYQ